jgi:hypothetical protein
VKLEVICYAFLLHVASILRTGSRENMHSDVTALSYLHVFLLALTKAVVDKEREGRGDN